MTGPHPRKTRGRSTVHASFPRLAGYTNVGAFMLAPTHHHHHHHHHHGAKAMFEMNRALQTDELDDIGPKTNVGNIGKDHR